MALLACALLVAGLAGSAAAQPPPRRWYGWQLLPSDLGGVSLLAIGAKLDGAARATAMIAGATSVLFGAPTVHWAHGHVGKGFGSLGLRVGASALAFVAMVVTFGNPRGLVRALLKGLVAVALAAAIIVTTMIIDNAVLAREDEAVSQSAAPLRAGGRAPATARSLRALGWSFRF